jgi:hypothetical protein
VLVASFAGAQHQKEQKAKGPSVVLVVAHNPDPSIGTFAALTLADAESENASLASLDPVCWAVPQVCEARAAATVYEVFYSDGTSRTI